MSNQPRAFRAAAPATTLTLRVAAAAALLAAAVVTVSTAAAQDSDNDPDEATATTTTSIPASACVDSLGTLASGQTERSGTASDQCRKHLPHGYSYLVENDSGATHFFTFTLSSPSTVTVALDHGTSSSDIDMPVLEVFRGHYAPSMRVGRLMTRAAVVNDTAVPISVEAVLAAGDYTAQVANYNWLWGGSFTYSLTIDVASADTGDLALTGTTSLTFPENRRLAVAGYGAAGGDGITWTLSGDDADDLSVSGGGTLSFRSPPDYENPADADTDNEYLVTLTASDGTNTGTLDVRVTVTDLDESEDGGPGGL